MDYLLRCSVFSGFDALVTSLGGKPNDLLRRFQLPVNMAAKADQFVPFNKGIALLEHCAQHLDCADFGIQLSKLQGIAMLGPVAVLVRNAATVHDAFQAVAHYMHVVAPGVRITLEAGGARSAVRLRISIIDASIVRSRQFLEMLMGNGTRIARMLTGENVRATRMCFPHARLASLQTYEAAFGCEVWFEQNLCAVDIEVSLMQRRVAGADRETAAIAAEYLEAHHGRTRTTLDGQVRNVVRRLLPTGHCSIGTVASSLGHHPRTLQRRLAERGLTLAGIVDAERRRLAEAHLSQPEMLLTQVTGLLGYANQSALNRSCRRWFNATPEQLRRSQLQSGALNATAKPSTGP